MMMISIGYFIVVSEKHLESNIWSSMKQYVEELERSKCRGEEKQWEQPGTYPSRFKFFMKKVKCALNLTCIYRYSNTFCVH